MGKIITVSQANSTAGTYGERIAIRNFRIAEDAIPKDLLKEIQEIMAGYLEYGSKFEAYYGNLNCPFYNWAGGRAEFEKLLEFGASLDRRCAAALARLGRLAKAERNRVIQKAIIDYGNWVNENTNETNHWYSWIPMVRAKFQ